MSGLKHPRPMKDFDPTKPARLHDQLNDALYYWPGAAAADWLERASWHDHAETVVNFDALLFDAWQSVPGSEEGEHG
jgi:hypothetical protein